MAWPLRLDQEDYGRFGVDLNTSLLFNRYGNVCGCSEFWNLFTNPQIMDPSPPAQLSGHLSSDCPYAGAYPHYSHAPSQLGGATEVATRATTPISPYNPRLQTMSTAEPHARPSHELKETCIFWYHGNCRRAADCPFEHELNHNWPISRPHGYSHDGYRRCDLQFCPFRTDLVEFLQCYYPDGPRVDGISEESNVKQEEAEQKSTTLRAETAESDSDETDECSTGFIPLHVSRERSISQMDGNIKHEAVVDNVSARPSDSMDTKAPSVQATASASPQDHNHEENFSPHAKHLSTEGSALKNHEVGPTSAPVDEDDRDASLEVKPGRQKKKKRNKKTHRGRRALKPGSVRQPVHQSIVSSVTEQPQKKSGESDQEQRGNYAESLITDEQALILDPLSIPLQSDEAVTPFMRSLTPSPSGTPQITLSPTFISHTGTQKRKSETRSHGNRVPDKKPGKRERKRLKMAAKKELLSETHVLATEPEVAFLAPSSPVDRAETSELKRKFSAYQADARATMYPSKEWLRDFWVDTEKVLDGQEYGLPPKRVVTPLVDRITHDQSTGIDPERQGPATVSALGAPPKASRSRLAARITYQHAGPKMVLRGHASRTHSPAHHVSPPSPQAALERPGTCFFWYHKGYCRPKPRQDGSPQVCKYLHQLVPGEKVTLPPAINAQLIKHNPDCSLELCPLGSSRPPLEY